MKIGIDISNEFIRLNLKNKLKNMNNIIVDLSDINAASLGERLYRKVIMANHIKLNLFINIVTFENFKDEIVIFSKLDNDLGMKIENGLKSTFKTRNISSRDGTYLYVIKNIKTKTCVINIPKDFDQAESLKFVECIYDSIISNIS